jgi:uncharacterized protein (TIGR00375 family)
MRIVADLHIHSYLSRACSPLLKPACLYEWCQLKGVTVLATGDFTPPRWFAELRDTLVEAEPGLFAVKPDVARAADEKVFPSCRALVRFVLGVEISCIYKKGTRVRKVHHLVFLPSFAAAERFNARLGAIGNLRSDGRPIVGLDSRNLLELVLEADPQAVLIPAHAWTPHFAVFGSESGFDSLEECFDDLTPHIFAIETGLSSDPLMNWRLSALDGVTLISNSDAHSLEKLAREANLFDTELSYQGLFDAIKRRDGRFLKTLEFFPEEGKYHVDGHRKCQARLDPTETLRRGGLCPVCGKPVTVGVLHRVERLADRPQGQPPSDAAGFEHLIPLKEVLSEVLRVGPTSVKVDAQYRRLLERFGNELSILRELPLNRLESEFPVLAVALDRMRRGQVSIEAGYDGEYGRISLLSPQAAAAAPQLALFDAG